MGGTRQRYDIKRYKLQFIKKNKQQIYIVHFHALEKEMATHSSILAWRIPGTAEPGGLPPTGSHRVGHDGSDLVVVVVYIVQMH